MRVVIAGQGYVGLPLAVRGAEVGHEVVGHGVDTVRVGRLARGESYVQDLPAERLRAVLADRSYRPSIAREARHLLDTAGGCTATRSR